MRDIVVQLRYCPYEGREAELKLRAADLIEDLRIEIIRLHAELKRANSPVWHDPKYGLVND